MKGVTEMKRKQKPQILLNVVFVILCALIIYPFLMLVSVSFSKESDIAHYGYKIIPMSFDISAYRYVFANPASILNAYKITAIFSLSSMVCGVALMSMLAYPLSRRQFNGKRVLSYFIYFTMLFSGGLVPSYILITKYLHLDDTILVYILPSLISVWHTFMMKNFFNGIPEEMVEAVFIDGGNEYTVFFKMILPLSKPVLATVALFTFLGKWNDWNTSMLYINDSKLFSLQYLLQRILKDIELMESNNIASTMLNMSEVPAETARMAMAVIVAGPALVVFPFFQKYFVKGMTVGSVKG